MITSTEEVRANCQHDRCKRFGKTKCGEQRFRCRDCGKTFVQSTRTLDGMTIGTDVAAQIVNCMMEGMGVRATARLTGVSKNTIQEVLLLVGERCKRYMEGVVQNVPVRAVGVDELWSFCSMKNRTRIKKSLPVEVCGDVYCWIGLESNHKMVLAWHMGQRTDEHGWQFAKKLKRACADTRFQVSSDGWRSYKFILSQTFPKCDIGMVVKTFGSQQDTGRYSPARIIKIRRKVVLGNPDERMLNTSHVERHNLTLRCRLRRYTRLTNGFSRRHRNHEAALAIYFCHYNWVQRHATLKTTPAVAAGLADHQWTVQELIERTASYSPPQKTAFEKFIDTLPDDGE